jgi:coenzyme F420-reducing hydrogenase alpha subunit
MHRNHHINIHEVTRVEGHGSIVIDIKRGRIRELRLDIIESPRFFEAMLVGRRYDEAHHIMSRICGICAVSHTSASLKAIEDAMGMKISKRTRLLRELAFSAETLQSHILHLYFLVIPDFFRVGSFFDLMKKKPSFARCGLKLKHLANEVLRVVGGRYVHPISLWPGGVVYAPGEEELKKLREPLNHSFELLEKTLESFSGAPSFSRKREFISIRPRKGYGLYEGSPFSSELGRIKPKSYASTVKEYLVRHSTAKHSVTEKGAFMVGALSRVNNNFKQLGKRAKKAASRLGLTPPCHNPFMNNHAQLVECFDLTESAIEAIDALILLGPKKEEKPARPRKYGRGIGIVEAPRGTLYHDYTITKNGLVEKANCIIPTAQNLNGIEEDLRGFVPTLLDKSAEEIRRNVEMLVRAYDPCISCATHIMNVEFVNG